MEVLLEVHDEEELVSTAHPDAVDLVGVNNRNLHDFSLSLDTSLSLAEHISADFVKVSESGISTAAALVQLRSAGYRGFLLGEAFMRHSHPEKACAALVQEVLALTAATPVAA